MHTKFEVSSFSHSGYTRGSKNSEVGHPGRRVSPGHFEERDVCGGSGSDRGIKKEK